MHLLGLARQLVTSGLLDAQKVHAAVHQAQQQRIPLVTWLVQNKWVDSRVLMELAAEQFGVTAIDLNTVQLEEAQKDLISETLARQHRILPLYRRANTLYIAMSDPGNTQAINDIQFSTGVAVEPLLVEDDKLGYAIDKLYTASASELDSIDVAELNRLAVEQVEPADLMLGDESEATGVNP